MVYFRPYFDDEFHQVVDDLKLDSRELSRASNPKYLEHLMQYIDNHKTANQEARADLDQEKLLLLETHEHFLIQDLSKLVDKVSAIAFHYSLKRSLDEAYDRCWQSPEALTTYFLWDHMA